MVENRRGAKSAAALDIGSVVAAFSEQQVERVTGLTKGRLRYWAETDFFKPSFVEENSRLPYSRFYSFKDIVALRTLELLRVQNNIPLQHLRKVAEKLSHLKDDLWVRTTLFVINRKVAFVNPESGEPEEVISGQYLLGIPLKTIIEDTNAEIIRLSKRPSDSHGKVSRNRSVVRNAWVITGTRISVGSVKRLDEDGYSISEIIEEYPDLTREDVEAALRHSGKEAA